MRASSTLLVAAIWFSPPPVYAAEHDPPPPDILSRLIAAAQTSGDPLASTAREGTTYSLRRAEYVGRCEAPFGGVHVAQLFFIRSAPKGITIPARGHSYLVFFDARLRARKRWDLDQPLSGLAVGGTRLLLHGRTVLDFANPPEQGSIVVDGKPQPVPTWEPLE